MFQKHNHQWKEIARTYAWPLGGIRGHGYGSDELERLAFGVTTILWECQDPNCKQLRKEEMLGKEPND